ncbi:MAG TPA: Ig-like domain-containing protein [Gemmatimonadaceae bacterium]|jgi:hypothetical protein
MRRTARVSVGAIIAMIGVGCRIASDLPSAIIEPAAPSEAMFIAPARIEIARTYLSSEVASVRTFGGGTPDIVDWSSSDTTVVVATAIDARSVRLTGRAGGTATITASTADGRKARVEVVVTPEPPMRWNPVPPKAVLVDGIRVSGVTRVDSAPPNAIKGSVLYTIDATLRNNSSSERSFAMGACSIWLTVHGGGGWYDEEMRPLAWDQLVSGHACTDEPKTVRLPPGASYTVSTSVFAHELSAAITSNYRYFFHAHVRLDTTEVVVDADSAVVSYPSSDLVASAATTVVGQDTSQSLRTTATLTNSGAFPAYIEYGACAMRIFAYSTPDRSGPPKWDSNLRRPWHGTYGQGCPLYLATTTIQPGAVFAPKEFSFNAPLIEMLADSLPDGRYYFSADIGFSNRPPIRVPAGSLDLVLPRQPLATSRVSDLMTFTAIPVEVSGSPASVRARATATLDYAGGALIEFSRDCPITLYAYRDRGRRDTAPRSGAADWTQPLACGPDQVKAVMNRGDTRTMETTVPVRDILGASLPSGHYYFAVALRAEGNRVFLAAGDADLVRQ